jgi:hypothetical protein
MDAHALVSFACEETSSRGPLKSFTNQSKALTFNKKFLCSTLEKAPSALTLPHSLISRLGLSHHWPVTSLGSGRRGNGMSWQGLFLGHGPKLASPLNV